MSITPSPVRGGSGSSVARASDRATERPTISPHHRINSHREPPARRAFLVSRATRPRSSSVSSTTSTFTSNLRTPRRRSRRSTPRRRRRPTRRRGLVRRVRVRRRVLLRPIACCLRTRATIPPRPRDRTSRLGRTLGRIRDRRDRPTSFEPRARRGPTRRRRTRHHRRRRRRRPVRRIAYTRRDWQSWKSCTWDTSNRRAWA